MEQKKLDKYLFDYNEKEILYKQNPTTTAAIFNVPKNSIAIHSKQTDTSFMLSMNKQNRFIEISPHKHDYVEIQYIYSGTCYQTIDGNDLILKQGNICIIDTNLEHSIKAAGDKDIFINILLSQEYFSKELLYRLSEKNIISRFLINSIFNSKGNYMHFTPQDESKCKYFISALLCEYYDNKINSFEAMDCYFLLFFTELLRTVHYTYYQEIDSNINTDNLLYILKYIESNYLTCTLNSTASQFGYHPNYLSSFLHKSIGKTFKNIVLEQRLIHAASYLKKTSLSIDEIAFKCGFTNITSFYKKFKEYYSLSPNDYRLNKWIL